MDTLVTLCTDLWYDEYIINTIKYIFIKENINVIDVNNKIQRNYLLHAAYCLKNIIKFQSSNTWNIVLVGLNDNEDNTHFIITEYENNFIISPNNGFYDLLDSSLIKNQYAIKNEFNLECFSHLNFTQNVLSALKHYQKYNNFNDISDKNFEIKKINPPKFQNFQDKIICDILFINVYNNVIVNLTKTQFEEIRQGRNFKYIYMPNEYIDTISVIDTNMFLNLQKNIFMFFNENNYLEICLYMGDFASLLKIDKLKANDTLNMVTYKQLLKYHKITIQFE